MCITTKDAIIMSAVIAVSTLIFSVLFAAAGLFAESYFFSTICIAAIIIGAILFFIKRRNK